MASLLTNCFEMLVLVRIGRPDILWSVNKLARAVSTWTWARDRRLARSISYIHHTNHFRQECHVGNTAQHCRLGLFQESDFAGDLEDSKSTSVGSLVYLWKPNICSHQKEAKETNVSNPQFYRVWNRFFWMLDCAWMDYLLSTFGTW